MSEKDEGKRASSGQSRASRARRREFRFEPIEAWQMARQFNRQVYAISRKFPKEEQFALLPQIRRASSSVMSNVAEGSGRNSDADFGHFLEIAYGSLMEVVSQLFVALDENYIAQEQFDAIAEEADFLAGKIVNLSKSLGRTARFTSPRP
jgi:four helix bundle protein